MKHFITILSAIVLMAISFTSCGESTYAKENEQARLEREQFVKDSIAKAEFVRDSLNKITVQELAPLFVQKTDKYLDCTWVEPKSAPKYRDCNGVYCYFQLKDGVPCNFRFVYQYYASDWLFIRNMIFHSEAGDKSFNITIAPDMDRDCGYGGKIWEWCDVPVYQMSYDNDVVKHNVTELLLTAFTCSDNIEVRMNGSEYYDERKLTKAQIQSIRDTYRYYEALGGKFI